MSVIDIRERKESEAMLRRALDAATCAMVQVDEDGIIELANTVAGEMFSYPNQQLLRQSIEVLVPHGWREQHVSFRESYQTDRLARSMGRNRELYAVRSDGTRFPVEIGLTPIDGSSGRSTMATINDISDRKRHEQRIAEKNLHLERLNGELIEFAYSASHDLKAPLASIAGLLRFCQMDLQSGDVEEVAGNLDRCMALTSRLTTRIEDMLSLARSDMIDDRHEEIGVADTLQNIWEALDRESVQLQTDFRHTGPLKTVRVRFTAILENLLSNAIRFRDEAKRQSLVTVVTRTDEESFYLSVADNGVGIPTEHQERVFGLFQRLGNSTQPGSGLGLALVKKHVEHLHGRIDLESTPESTSFHISLPLQLHGPADANG